MLKIKTRRVVWPILCLVTAALCFGLAGVLAKQPTAALADDILAYYIDGAPEASVAYSANAGGTGKTGLVANVTSPNDRIVLREVVDLREKTKSDSLVSIVALPGKEGAADFGIVNIYLIDAYDESNYVRVNVKPYPGLLNTTNTAFSLAAASNGQRLSGQERNATSVRVEEWGLWTYWKFFTANVSYGYQISFDCQENAVYVVDGADARLLADFDDQRFFGANLWEGFTTGEVYIKIELNELQASAASVLIERYAGSPDLSQTAIRDTGAPRLTVDFGDYSEADYPQGLKGYAYPLFRASAFDLYAGAVDVDTQVYLNYYSGNPVAMNIDGRNYTFTPEVAATYHIVYSAADDRENTANKALPLPVGNSAGFGDISVSLNAYEASCVIGDKYALPVIAGVSNCIGNYSLAVSIANEGAALAAEDGFVRPVRVGGMTITYTVVDFLGRTVNQSVNVTVTAATKPTFMDEPVLPKYMVEGNKYTLPAVLARDYTDGSGRAVAVTVKAQDKNGTAALVGGAYTPWVAQDGGTVKITYEATAGGQTASMPYTIPVYKTRDGSAIDKTKYFVAQNGTLAGQATTMRLTASAPAASYEYINSVYSNEFSIAFIATANSKNIGKMRVKLTDYYDQNNAIGFDFIKQGTGVKLCLNGDETKVLEELATLSVGAKFSLRYDNTNRRLYCFLASQSNVPVQTNLSGQAFNGFAANEYYLTVEFSGVSGTGSVDLDGMTGGIFNSDQDDWAGPNVSMRGDIGGDKTPDTVYALPEVFSWDAFDGKTDIYLTVTDPDFEPVSDVSGTPLSGKLIHGESYSIKLAKYGNYTVRYVSTDSDGNESRKSFVVAVIDGEKPVLSLKSAFPQSVKRGDKVHVPDIEVSDNKDAAQALTVHVFVISPNFEMHTFDITFDADGKRKAQGFNANETGTYTVVYSVSDTEGNVTVAHYGIRVEEA
ncbi:MAG: DUF4625 domain-containing protein [Clostridiales bacterium]|jgi:hypothetical protein|nr:DUF4625 domain-containing protein [Clostridiales bacterium]